MDAVPGRKAMKATGSTFDLTFCQPCSEDGKRILPEAFCPVCREFLCSNCARVHRNMKLTKSHALQDKSSMPSSFRSESEDEKLTETCRFHAKEFIKYFCPHHNNFLCGDCLAENEEHRSCKVEKIYQAAKRYKEGAKYNSLQAGLGQMVSDIENYSSYIQSSLKSVDDESLTNINELRTFRNKINQYLDKREKELLKEIDQKKQKSESLLNELKVNCQDLKSVTEKLKAELQAKEVNNNQLFVSGTRAIKELVGLQSSLEDIRRRGKVPHSKFSRDPATEQLLSSNTAIGRVDQVVSDLADQQKQPQGPGQNNSSIYQHLSSQNNALTEQIDKNNVVLEGGGQFEEGQAYMIRDRQGNARKMILTKGDFMPLQEPDKSNHKTPKQKLICSKPHGHHSNGRCRSTRKAKCSYLDVE